MQTLLSKLDRLPPCLCRLMAKGADGRLLSNADIKRRTGWGNSRLKRISNATSFKNVTVGEVDVFLSACGLRWSSQRRLIWLMQRTWRLHGHNGPGWILKMNHLKFKVGWQASMVMRHHRRIEKLLSNNKAT